MQFKVWTLELRAYSVTTDKFAKKVTHWTTPMSGSHMTSSFRDELTICWSEDKQLWLALFFASSATWKPVYVSWKDLCWQFHDLFKRQPPERLTEKKIYIKFKNSSLITNNIGMTINFLTLWNETSLPVWFHLITDSISICCDHLC